MEIDHLLWPMAHMTHNPWPLHDFILRVGLDDSEISVTETITETKIIDPTLTETEMMVILKTEIL